LTQLNEIRDFVEERCLSTKNANQKVGVQASTVAEHFGIWQGEATKALNELVSLSQLDTIGMRPILYVPAAKPEPASTDHLQDAPPFAKMIGYNGSLKYQTQIASAAVSYPPHGIHTLIIGKTGVGKSLLASEIARYLSSIRGASVPFITFNCAEYSDNPQLLLAQLFGYVKGAFTGAETNKSGLIESANNGILFLDELHRLSPTGQEMLFTLIDKGLYRRLGDTTDRSAKIMIIGATTENPADCLLNTFKRRIPLLIQIPELCERPINERLDIITWFIYEEAHKLGRPIRLSHLALKLLVSFRGENNIGDLRNEIRVACAQSNWSYGNRDVNDKSTLPIDIYNLSRNLSIHYLADEHVDAYFSAAGLDTGLEISCDRPISFSPSSNEVHVPFDFQHFVEQKMLFYRGLGKDVTEAEHLIVTDLDKQYKQYGRNAISGGVAPPGIVYGSVAPVVWQATNELIHYATIEFEKSYDQDIINSVAYYLQQLKSYANAGRIIFSPSSFENISEFLKEKSFITKIMPLLKNYLSIELMDGEIMLLAMLLAHASVGQYKPSVNLLLCGYANSATGIAAFANSLLNTSFIKALDMPDNLDVATLRSKILGALGDNFQNTLILCGLNISSVLWRALSKDSLLYFRILPILDPMMVLECGRMILMANNGIDEIAAKLVNEYHVYLDSAMNEAFTTVSPTVSSSDESAEDRRDVIITYCITGVGSARIVREMLLQDLSVASAVDILPLGIKDDIFSIFHKLGKRLKLIIGIMNPDIPGVPYVSIEQFLYSKGPSDLLRSKGISLPANADIQVEDLSGMPLEVQLNHIGKHLYYFAPSLDAKKIEKSARYIIEKIRQLYQVPLPSDLIVRIYIHCATMFERIATAAPIPMPLDGYAAIEHNHDMFQKLKEVLNTRAEELDLIITDAEVYYLMITLPLLVKGS
jgi:transcriptional regulator with AAA-type ATPase domain/transcriptional regulatory protein LevR